ncbi:MAG: LapA family protein [Gammaproteobacteria bacterium]|nr:LapA family protein [Gammaproteobacteria bacterium]
MNKLTMHRFRFISSLILIMLLIIFVLQNAAIVTIHFLFWNFSVSRSLMIIIVLLTGVIVGWLSAGYFKHKQRQNHKPS